MPAAAGQIALHPIGKEQIETRSIFSLSLFLRSSLIPNPMRLVPVHLWTSCDSLHTLLPQPHPTRPKTLDAVSSNAVRL